MIQPTSGICCQFSDSSGSDETPSDMSYFVRGKETASCHDRHLLHSAVRENPGRLAEVKTCRHLKLEKLRHILVGRHEFHTLEKDNFILNHWGDRPLLICSVHLSTEEKIL